MTTLLGGRLRAFSRQCLPWGPSSLSQWMGLPGCNSGLQGSWFPGCSRFHNEKPVWACSLLLQDEVDCRGDEEGLLACPHAYTTAGCDTDTVAGVHCLPTPRQEAASKVAFLVLGMALALLLTVSGLGIFYLRTRGKTVSSMTSH